MNTKQAVAERIIEICSMRKITINTLANLAGMTPSTIYSLLNNKSQNPGIVTIKKICDGLDMPLSDFFDSPVFENIQQEIL